MLKFILNYLLVATLVTWFLDFVATKVSSKQYQFTRWEKVMIWVGWPLFIITFIVIFISTFFRNKNE